MRLTKIRAWTLGIMVSLLGLFTAAWWLEMVSVSHEENHTTVRIVSLLPLHPTAAANRLQLIAENPRIVPRHETHLVNPFTLLTTITESNRLRGQEVTVRLDRAATRIPWVKKSVTVRTRRPVHPSLVRIPAVVPSGGPVPISFNAPLQPESVPGNIRIILNGQLVNGTLTPLSVDDGGVRVVDYATWLFQPEQPFPHNIGLELVVGPRLRSAGGLPKGTETRGGMRTAPPLKMTFSKPRDGATGVDLHPEILAQFDQPLADGHIEITGLRGRVEVWADKIQFTPLEPLMPDREYSARIQAVSRLGERSAPDISFQTLSLGDKMWVAVDLEGANNVTIYRGSEVVRVFKASGGKVTTPTPLGTYLLYNRGYSFWNERLKEGAYYWVQFSGPYLVHSVPFDASGQLIPEELAKLGQPASHGCVRLSLEDAKWFYHHVPNGTMIVIYNQH